MMMMMMMMITVGLDAIDPPIPSGSTPAELFFYISSSFFSHLPRVRELSE